MSLAKTLRDCAPVSRGPAARSARPSAPTPSASIIASVSAAADAPRPAALGLVVTNLESVADGTRDRQAGNGHRVASTRIPCLLGVEKPASVGSADRLSGGSRADPHDVGGQPALGCASHSRGVAQAWLHDLSNNRREIHGPPTRPTLADVAHLLGEPRTAVSRGRLLRRPELEPDRIVAKTNRRLSKPPDH